MEFKIDLSFQVGDQAWSVKRSSLTSKCEDCNGKGELTLKVKGKPVKFRCPNCQGNGQKEHWAYILHLDKVSRIDIYVDTNGTKICYYTKDNHYDIPKIFQQDLFETKEEAQKECDRRNIQL